MLTFETPLIRPSGDPASVPVPITLVDSKDLAVGRVVAVGLEVLGQILGRLGDAGPDDEPIPSILGVSRLSLDPPID